MHKTYQILQWTQKLSGNNAHQQMQRKTAKPKATKKIKKKNSMHYHAMLIKWLLYNRRLKYSNHDFCINPQIAGNKASVQGILHF